MENLEFRRQYLLSNANIEKISNWKYFSITKTNLNLYYHPDLEIEHSQLQDKHLVLLGYIIDPFYPDLSNADIISRMINMSSFQDVLKETENLSGRFAIIYCHGENNYIFHDATGFREIYYCFLQDKIYCGSTPDIIKKYAKMEPDKDKVLNEFINSNEYKTSGFWVGIKTPFQNIFHLQPNFYLNLDKKNCHRYWPDKIRKEISLKEGANLMAQILKGTMIGATKRYELHQGLTSGFDSRVLLAASKGLKNQIKFLVNRVKKTTSSTADIKIPKIIAEKYNLNFEVVDIKNFIVDDNFRNIFYKNNVFSRETHIQVFYDAYIKKFDDTYWVTGTFGNEILRIAFPLKKKRISSIDIAKHFKYNNYSYAIDSIEDWLKEAEEVYSKYGYNLINMFYWEQYTGNWKNLGGSEGNITREEIRPFNCRKLITTYISLKDKYRYKDYPMGHLMIIKILWKELLEIPIAAYINTPSYWIKRTSRFLGIEILVDNIYNFIKNKLYYSSKYNI
jgi:hypothetical protein